MISGYGGTMSFGEAHAALMRGHLITRMAWGPHVWLRLCRPEETDIVSLPVILIDKPSAPHAYPGGVRAPWTPSAEDLVWKDWVVVE